MSEKKKFDPKLYYIKNKERILAYNRKYFKQYYQKKKQSLFIKPILNDVSDNVDNSTNELVIKKNVTVYF